MHLKHKLKNPVISSRFECKHHSAAIEESKKKVSLENHLNSSDQLYMQRTNKQTNKHQRGGKVGAWVQKVLEGRGEEGRTTQKYFTHVQVARQPHLGQHLHVPLSQADIVMD